MTNHPLRFSTLCALLGLCLARADQPPAAAAVPTAPLTPAQAAQAWAKRPSPAGAAVRVNSIGFLPGSGKVATVAGACGEFFVRRVSDDAVVFTGRAGAPVRTSPADTDETVQLADFSALDQPGRYVLDVPGVGRSAPFAIGTDIWNEPFRVVSRAMYLWRCGVGVKGEWQGHTFHHGPCHLEDGLLDYVGGPAGAKRPGTGGWHDAGDYNKYIVNAGVTVGYMWKAWEQFRDRIAAVRLDLPESGNGMPDLLNELRFEYEWMFTMQADDGRVYHKLSALDFRYFGPPDKDPSPRYFVPWSTTATADFVAMMALGARHFREFDAALADRCLRAAEAGWAVLVAHPEAVEPEQKAFHTGGYTANDGPHRLWAAIELFETTGREECLKEFEKRSRDMDWNFGGPTWADPRDLAFGTYLLSARPYERGPWVHGRLLGGLFAQVERIIAVGATNPHGRPFGGEPGVWFWGCNGSVAGQTYLLHVADRLRPDPRLRATALSAVGHLFGRNYHGRSYVSGLGANPPAHLHDRRGDPAWPGYLVGGAWPNGRHWFDETADFRTNEIAINWNGALIYALAAFVEPKP